MNVFVINLDKNADRLTKIDSRLKQIGVVYQRMSAVYGKEVPSSEKRKNSSRFWWWCIKGYPMRDGEYGCAISHLNAYRQMIARNLEIACILEDDAKPRPCLPRLLEYLDSTMDSSKPQVALISNHRDSEAPDVFAFRPIKSGAFADGYVITLPAARNILKANLPIKCPSDTWTFWQRKGWIELYQAYPEGVNQEWETVGYVSDVTVKGEYVINVNTMTMLSRVVWRIKRFVGLAIAYMFLHNNT